VCLGLIRAAGTREAEAFLDVGGGSSVLVDHLLAEGFADVTVLDVSERSLASSRARLGVDADRVHWVVADVLTWRPERRHAVWHDRAVFHFLTTPDDQAGQLSVANAALQPGGRMDTRSG
jgi:trans-aconitate methyltransferase